MKLQTPAPQAPTPDPDGRWRTASGLFRRWLNASGRGDWALAAELRRDILRCGYCISLSRPYKLTPRPAKWTAAPSFTAALGADRIAEAQKERAGPEGPALDPGGQSTGGNPQRGRNELLKAPAEFAPHESV